MTCPITIGSRVTAKTLRTIKVGGSHVLGPLKIDSVTTLGSNSWLVAGRTPAGIGGSFCMMHINGDPARPWLTNLRFVPEVEEVAAPVRPKPVFSSPVPACKVVPSDEQTKRMVLADFLDD